MKYFYQKLTLPIIWISLIVFTSCSEDEENKPATLSTKIDLYLEQNQPTDQPGLSIAIQKNGEVVYRGNRGLAHIAGSVSIGSDTQFRLASVSKPMTAIAIMKLVEANKLSLSDKLLDYLPTLPQNFSEITIEHLLSHRSGLLDFIDDNSDLNSLNNLTTAQALNIIEGSGLENLLFAPGTSGEYSNTGYVFLALIIEEVSGMSYPDYLQRELFVPAQMSNTFVISENGHLGDFGEDYALSFGNSLNVLGFNSLICGSSGVASTTNDLTRFTQALLNNEFISKASLDQMTETRGSIPGLSDNGLGWFTSTGNYWHTGKYTEEKDFWHTGGFDGYRTVLLINPDSDLQIVILTNGGEDTEKRAFDIIEITRNYYKN